MMTSKETRTEEGWLLSIALVTLYFFIGFVADALGLKTARTIRSGPGEVIAAFSIYYLGILFLLSYFYEHKCFLFRWLIWICVNFSHPREYGRKMAFIYFGLSLVIGTIALLAGLGIITE